MSTKAASVTSIDTKRTKRADGLALKNGTAPNPDALRRAALAFGLKPPAGTSKAATAELLGMVRVEVDKRLAEVSEDEKLECGRCLEHATDATPYCPFCGDDGEADEEAKTAEVVKAEAKPPTEKGVGIAKAGKSKAKPVADVDAGLASLKSQLDDKLAEIDKLKRSMVSCSYDIGHVVKEIRDKQLFKGKGYETFAAFAQVELPFTRESAYQLISIVEKFSRDDYEKIGYTKLRAIASVSDDEKRRELTEKARGGSSRREIEHAASVAKGKRSRSEIPPAEHKNEVTVVTKTGGSAKTVGFLSAKSGKKIAAAATVKDHDAQAFAEHKLGDDVVLRIALKVERKKIVGLTVKVERAER